MIILDTNVVSEPMKANCNPSVLEWLDRQVADTLHLTAINLAELLAGVAVLPHGKRRDGLDGALTSLLFRLFEGRILPFGTDAATVYAPMVARVRAAGRSISFADGQIAAIATTHGFSVATRDVAPFLAAGVPVINPWEEVK